jgi:hypothetical protein
MALSMSRRVGTGRRDARQRGRRLSPALQVFVQSAVQRVNASIEDGTLEISGVSSPFDLMRRVNVTGPSLETSKLDSELKDIFSQLHDLDVSIANANSTIVELRESTRSLIGSMLNKG